MLLIFSILTTSAISQGINFQGVARSANGTIIASSNISLRLSIISKNVDATPEYIETKTVFANAQGIFSIVVGDATNTVVTGNFKNIAWKDGIKFLKVEMDPSAGTNYINMGATQLQYVPYSFYSLGVDAANVTGLLPIEKGGTGVASISDLKVALVLDKVNNTADLTKPISTLTQTALDLKSNASDVTTSLALKANLASPTFTGTVSGITKTMVGLANVDNTTDAAKPISTLTQTALDLKSNASDVSTSLALKENISNKSTAVDLGGTSPSDILFPTQKAVKDYVAANNAAGGVADGGITTIKLADGAVTDAKINTVSGSKVIGNITGNAATATLATTATTAGNITATTNTTLSSLSSLTTVGTITSGTWSATTIALAKGGTGATTKTAGFDALSPMTTSGDIIYGGTSGSGTRLAKGSDGQILTLASGLPTWANASGGGVPYTGATQAVDLGSYDLTVNGLTIGKGLNNISGNTVLGINSLSAIGISGGSNTAIGSYNLFSNLTGQVNVSVGNSSLYKNISGSSNVSIGYGALYNNLNASNNVAVGTEALTNNTSGGYNTSIGLNSMYYNTVGGSNSALGVSALSSNVNGAYNTAIGVSALASNVSGSNNTAIGNLAMYNNTTYSNSTALGYNAQVTASNQIQLGNSSVTDVKTSGAITAASYKIPDGTSSQFLRADGSVASSINAITYELKQPSSINASSSFTIDFSTGNLFHINLGANVTNFNITNAVIGTYILKITQGGTYTFTFPGSWKWSGGTIPTITAVNGKIDIITLIYDGTNFYAAALQNF